MKVLFWFLVILVLLLAIGTISAAFQKKKFAVTVLSVVNGLVILVISWIPSPMQYMKELFGNEESITAAVSVTFPQTSAPYTTVPFTAPTTKKRTTSTKVQGATPTALKPGDKKLISALLEEGEKCTFLFTTPLSGEYRFDFGIDDVNCSYNLKLTDQTGKVFFSSYFSGSKQGENVKLNASETYTLLVEQTKGCSTCKIILNVPQKPVIIQ